VKTVIGRIHHRRGRRDMIQPQRMSKLMQRDSKQIVCRPNVKPLAGVKGDVPRDGIVIHRRWHVSRGQRVDTEVVARDANVTNSGFAHKLPEAAYKTTRGSKASACTSAAWPTRMRFFP